MSEYREALNRVALVGSSRASDPEVMAQFLESSAHILLGAVSPELIWNGATSRGMSCSELARMVHSQPDQARDLMWTP